jgi:hypothetical protein
MGTEEQAHVLAQMSKALARTGLHHEAEAIARSIPSPTGQAHALAGIAEALAETGKLREASRIAAEACTIGPWESAVRAVLAIDPDASRILAERLSPGGASDAEYPWPS